MLRRLLAPGAVAVVVAWAATRAAEAPPSHVVADALRHHVEVLAADGMAGSPTARTWSTARWTGWRRR